MPGEILNPAQVRALREAAQRIRGYTRWEGGTDPARPDVIAVHYNLQDPGRSLRVLIGPYRDEARRTGVEFSISGDYAVYRIAGDGADIELFEPDTGTMLTVLGNPPRYIDGLCNMLLGIAGNPANRGRKVTSASEAESIIEAVRRASLRSY